MTTKNDPFWKVYDAWLLDSKERWNDSTMSKYFDRVEFCEDGTVFVHPHGELIKHIILPFVTFANELKNE